MEIFSSILIELPPDKVFDCLSDFNLSGFWSSMVIEPAPAPDMGQLQVGFSYTAQLRLLNQMWKLTYQIIEYEQGRLLTSKTTTGWLPGFITYGLAPEGPENAPTTRLTYRHEFELVKFFNPFETLLQKSLVRQARTDLANLKDWLESGLYTLNKFSH